MVFFSKVWLGPGLAPLVLCSPGSLFPGALVPWFWSSGPLASRLQWLLQWLLGFSASVASWLLGFSGFVALGFLASVASWLLGFSGSWLLGFGGSLASQDLNNFISRMAT